MALVNMEAAASYFHVELTAIFDWLLKMVMVKICALAGRWRNNLRMEKNSKQNREQTVKAQTDDYGAESFCVSCSSFEKCGPSRQKYTIP